MPKKTTGTDVYTSTANRPRMGMTAQQLPADTPSMSEVRKGYTVAKTGNAKGAAIPDAGTATHRGQVMAATLGAQYRITARRAPYMQTDARTQANGRIVPPAGGSQRNFRSAY